MFLQKQSFPIDNLVKAKESHMTWTDSKIFPDYSQTLGPKLSTMTLK